MTTRIKARPDFSTVLARAGFSRGQLADAAEVSSRTIDSLANPAGYGRQGYTRELTAWKIAKGFAQLTGQADEPAYTQLFIKVEEHAEAPV
jgi:hypothetical protein